MDNVTKQMYAWLDKQEGLEVGSSVRAIERELKTIGAGDVELLKPAGVPEGKCPHMGAEGCNWKRGLPCNK